MILVIGVNLVKKLRQRLQQNSQKRIIISVLSIIVLMTFYYLQGQILLRAINLKLKYDEINYSEQISLEVMYCLIFAVLVVCAFIVYFLVVQKKPVWSFNWSKLKITIFFYLISLGLQFLLGIINQKLNGEIQTANNQQIIDIADLRIDFAIVLLFTATFLSPIFEEIIYRGLIISGIFKEHQLIGVFIQAVLFGAAHQFTNIWQYLIYFCTGTFLGLIYWQTQDIKYSILGHFTQNLLGSIEIIHLLLV